MWKVIRYIYIMSTVCLVQVWEPLSNKYLSCFALVLFISRFYVVWYRMRKWGKWKDGDMLLIGYVTYMGYGVGCVLSLHKALLVCGDVQPYAMDMAGKSLRGCLLIRIV